jgi:putative hemolysin
MNKKEIIGIVVFLFLAGCINAPPSGANNSSNHSNNNQSALANPASQKCIADGGADKVLSNSLGQYGLCMFNDGSVCEEWAYYNGNCSKGECMRYCGAIGTRSEGWYDCHGNLLYWDNCTNESAKTAGTC